MAREPFEPFDPIAAVASAPTIALSTIEQDIIRAMGLSAASYLAARDL